jgi:hypothetical protein
MEHFFTPTRRLQDRYDDFAFDEDHGYTEVQLAVSAEAFLNSSWDWSEFHAFATSDVGGMGTIIWITEDTFIWVEGDNTEADFGELEHCAIFSVLRLRQQAAKRTTWSWRRLMKTPYQPERPASSGMQ